MVKTGQMHSTNSTTGAERLRSLVPSLFPTPWSEIGIVRPLKTKMADKLISWAPWKKLTSEIFFPPQRLVASWLVMMSYLSLCCVPQVPCNGWLLGGLYQFMWSRFLFFFFFENVTSINNGMGISDV